jgi:hypothetical protein
VCHVFNQEATRTQACVFAYEKRTCTRTGYPCPSRRRRQRPAGTTDDPYPLQQASQEAKDLLARIRQLPLEQLFANVLGITQGLNQLVNAPETQVLVRSLSSTTTDVPRLVRHLDSGVVRLLDDVE